MPFCSIFSGLAEAFRWLSFYIIISLIFSKTNGVSSRLASTKINFMNLKLHKPLCIFDLETTGINISKDRIIEICILKVFQILLEKAKLGM